MDLTIEWRSEIVRRRRQTCSATLRESSCLRRVIYRESQEADCREEEHDSYFATNCLPEPRGTHLEMPWEDQQRIRAELGVTNPIWAVLITAGYYIPLPRDRFIPHAVWEVNNANPRDDVDDRSVAQAIDTCLSRGWIRLTAEGHSERERNRLGEFTGESTTYPKDGIVLTELGHDVHNRIVRLTPIKVNFFKLFAHGRTFDVDAYAKSAPIEFDRVWHVGEDSFKTNGMEKSLGDGTQLTIDDQDRIASQFLEQHEDALAELSKYPGVDTFILGLHYRIDLSPNVRGWCMSLSSRLSRIALRTGVCPIFYVDLVRTGESR